MNAPARRFIAAALTILISTCWAFAYSDEAVEEAEKLVETLTGRFNSGYASRTDVAEAQYYLIEMKFKAGKISRATYCQSGVETLRVQRDLFRNQVLTGTGNLVSFLNSGREFYKLKAFCEERKHR